MLQLFIFCFIFTSSITSIDPTVTSRMPHSTLSLSFSFYNYLGISSIVFKKNGISASRVIGITNVARCLIVLMFALVFLGNDELKVKALRIDLRYVDKLTIVAKVAFYVSTLVNEGTAIFLCIRQYSNQQKVLGFIKSFDNVQFSEKLSIRLKQTWKNHFIVMFALFFFNSIVQCYGRSQFTLFGVFVFCLLTYPYYILMIFMSLMTTFEYVISTFLKDFENDLTNAFVATRHGSYKKLSRRHQKIYDLHKAFNGAFGLDYTILTSCLACTAILQA